MNDLEKKPETVPAPPSVPGAPAQAVAGQPAVMPQASAAAPQAAEPEAPPSGVPGHPIPLKLPFKAGDKTLTKVVFSRRPKARDLIQHVGAATAAEQELHGIAALIGVIPEDLMEMDGADYLAVQKEWAAFLTN